MSSLQQTRYEIQARTSAAPEGYGTARSTGNVASNLSPHLVNANSETINGTPLSIALIGPNETTALGGGGGSEPLWRK